MLTRDELYRLYWTKNKTIKQIAQMYGVSQKTLVRYMNRHDIVRRDKSAAIRLWLSPDIRKRMGAKRRKKFNSSPSSTLSYVLGVLLGDGFVHKSGGRYYVNLRVKDWIFAEKFMKALKKIRLNPYIFTDSRGYCWVQAISVNFYEWYEPLKLDLEKVKTLIQKFEKQFVCGFYESEGSIVMHRKKFRADRLRVDIYNQRKELLSIIKNIFSTWGIKSWLLGPDKRGCFRLEVEGNKRVEKLLRIIKPCIKTHWVREQRPKSEM